MMVGRMLACCALDHACQTGSARAKGLLIHIATSYRQIDNPCRLLVLVEEKGANTRVSQVPTAVYKQSSCTSFAHE